MANSQRKVTTPRDEPPPSAKAGQREAPAAATIAVVDDSAVVRQVVTGQLRGAGYQVVAFAGGEPFVAWLKTGRCDAVLLDSQMPGWSGLEVLKHVRERFNREELPILFVTANSRTEHAVEALTNGANDFIVKPFDTSVLSARLGLQVALRRSQAQLRNSIAIQAKIQLELERRAEVALTELKLAAKLQTSICQFTDPPRFLSASCQVRPSSHVSGDILYSRITADGRYLLFLGDATGHGVTAALITMLVVALLKNLDGPEVTPRNILRLLNRQLMDYPLDGKFVSGIAITVSADGTLVAANAGHPPGIVVGTSLPEPVLLESGGPPLGWFGDEDYYEESTMRLVPGESVVLFTDGLSECQDREQAEFGIDSVVRVAHQAREADPQALFERILGAALDHAQDNLNADDVSVAVLRFVADSSGVTEKKPDDAFRSPAATVQGSTLR
jgi:sigma-B regulation protein RsbU (phosphoserine phosphatase)